MGLFSFFMLIFSVAFYYYFNQDVNNKLKTKLTKIALNVEKSDKLSKNIKIINKKLKEDFIVQDLGETLKATLIFPFKNRTIIITKIVDDKSEDVVDSMLVIEPILLLFLLVAVMKLTNKIFTPIEEITQISKKISINNFNTTIPNFYQEKEIKELINSFNEMIKRVHEGVENLDRFNSDVSHELKTPLTIIKGEISVSLKKTRDTQSYIESMKVINKEVEEMNTIIDNLLLLTKFTKENILQTFQNCDLDIILLKVLEKYENKNIEVSLENIQYYGNSQLLYHLFFNIIDNAIKYSKSKVEIKLYKNNKIYFEVIDDGEGIENKELDKITNRFYRVDKSRNKSIKGFGLGLSIVKKVVELHNMQLKINSEIGKRTRVVVEL